MTSPAPTIAAAPLTAPATRYLALDALRGFTIAMMILVNTPGSWSFIYAPFAHADWHGVTPTDLVFPFFLFVVGSAMYFSLGKQTMSLTPAVALSITRRTLMIFALGLIFNGVLGGWENLRIMGVLQRIALAYALAAVIVLMVARTGVYVISALLLLGYWLLLVLGGGADPFDLTTNLVVKFDLAVLGADHLYQGKGVPFDPEGLLSTLPAVVNVLIGFEITRLLVAQPDRRRGLIMLLQLGTAGIVLGLLWNFWLPINKSLWTSSFVIYTAGYFCFALALFVWIVDIQKSQRLAQPFIIYGSNSIFIYMLAPFWVHAYVYIPFGGTNFYDGLFLLLAQVFPPKFASLLFALLHVSLFWIVSWLLYRKKIFIRV
jgi:predicted acyltransferase